MGDIDLDLEIVDVLLNEPDRKRRKARPRFDLKAARRNGRRCRRCGLPGDREPYKIWHPRDSSLTRGRGNLTSMNKLHDRCLTPEDFIVDGFPCWATSLPKYNR